jgi:membrane peptidoglycan carboxypeptidase
LAIGYEVALTALQLAQAYAVFANGGILIRPTLVKRVLDPRGRVRYEHEPEPVRRVVRRDVADELREMLRGVVGEGGTGASAALQTHELAGKTGTARRVGPTGYSNQQHTAVFVALFPVEDPQIVSVVRLDAPRGSYAAVSAAPLTRRMLEEALAARSGGIDRERLARPTVRVGRARTAGPEQALPRAVVPWPVVPVRPNEEPRRVPEVQGLTLRDAVARLHRAGLRVRAEGRGQVTGTDPAAGDSVAPGTLIRVRARAGGAR